MSDSVKHECGITLIRLLKPLSYYQEKYGTPLWGFFKLFLMMEKQHNRGQDGAGVAALKLDVPNGLPFMFRERNIKTNPLDKIFKELLGQYQRKVDRRHLPNIVMAHRSSTFPVHPQHEQRPYHQQGAPH